MRKFLSINRGVRRKVSRYSSFRKAKRLVGIALRKFRPLRYSWRSERKNNNNSDNLKSRNGFENNRQKKKNRYNSL